MGVFQGARVLPSVSKEPIFFAAILGADGDDRFSGVVSFGVVSSSWAGESVIRFRMTRVSAMGAGLLMASVGLSTNVGSAIATLELEVFVVLVSRALFELFDAATAIMLSSEVRRADGASASRPVNRNMRAAI